MSRATTIGPVSDRRVFTGCLRQLGADLVHRPGEVDAHDVAAEVVVGDLGQELGRVGLELLEEHAVGGDLGQRLAVGRARHGERDRAARRRGGAGG